MKWRVPLRCIRQASVILLKPKFNTFSVPKPDMKREEVVIGFSRLTKIIKSSEELNICNLRANFSLPSSVKWHRFRFKYKRAERAVKDTAGQVAIH